MPLFECSQCHCVDNTALTNYFWNVDYEKKPALCSECDPEIKRWHGEFTKIQYVDFIKLHGKDAVRYPIVKDKS